MVLFAVATSAFKIPTEYASEETAESLSDLFKSKIPFFNINIIK